MSTAQIAAYVAAILAAGLTTAVALRIARRSEQRHYWAYLLFILTTNIVCLLDLVFRSFIWKFPGISLSITVEKMDMLMGFLIVPLVAAFTISFAAFVIGIVGRKAPASLQRIYGVFWILLFCGFVAAEITYFDSGSRALTEILEPVFNFGVLVGIVFAMIYAFVWSRLLDNPKEKLLARSFILYYLISLFFFFVWNTSQVPLNVRVSVMARSLLGIIYNIPPVIVLSIVLPRLYQAPVSKPAGSEALDDWFTERNISSREREIILLVLMGKTNRSIEKELFISKRTVESHLYNIYRKLRIKNRMQLMRLVSEKSRPTDMTE